MPWYYCATQPSAFLKILSNMSVSQPRTFPDLPRLLYADNSTRKQKSREAWEHLSCECCQADVGWVQLELCWNTWSNKVVLNLESGLVVERSNLGNEDLLTLIMGPLSQPSSLLTHSSCHRHSNVPMCCQVQVQTVSQSDHTPILADIILLINNELIDAKLTPQELNLTTSYIQWRLNIRTAVSIIILFASTCFAHTTDMSTTS